MPHENSCMCVRVCIRFPPLSTPPQRFSSLFQVVGVKLDEENGNTNGTVGGHFYFKSKKKRGCLVPLSQVKLAKGEKDRMKTEMKVAKASLKGKSRRESTALVDLDGDGKISDAEMKAYARKQAKLKKEELAKAEEDLDLDELLSGEGSHHNLNRTETKEGAAFTTNQHGTGSATLARREAAIALAEQRKAEEEAEAANVVTPEMRKVTQEQRQAARLQAAKDKKSAEQAKRAAEAAERAAKAAMRKEREKEMKDRKAAEMEAFRKAEAAKRAEADAEASAAQEKKRAEAAAWAKTVADVEAMDIGVWEKKTKLKELKEVLELRKAEDAKQEAEDEKIRQQEKKTAFMSRFQVEKADPDVKSLGDATMARNKAKRGSSKWSAPKPMAAIGEGAGGSSAAFSERKEFDPQRQYLVTSKHLATMRRPVGSKKAIFDAINEDLEEEHSSRQGEYDVACIYVETLVWSFPNRKSGNDFLDMMYEVVADDRQAEAFFQVYELPYEVEGASVSKGMRQYDNDYLPGSADIRYLTVAIGTTEQYCDLHRIYDMRGILQADVTPWNESADAMRAATQLKHQRGIKHVTGTFNCIKKVASVGRVIDDWNQAENINIKFQVNKEVSVPGGWSTVSRFVGGTGENLLMSFGLYQSADKAGSDGALNWLQVARSEYQKVAPNIGEFVIFKGVKTPLDFETRESATNFSSFSMHSNKLWLKAKAKAKVSIDAEMEGVERCKRWFFGPGAADPDMAKYVASTRSNAKVSASILTPLV